VRPMEAQECAAPRFGEAPRSRTQCPGQRNREAGKTMGAHAVPVRIDVKSRSRSDFVNITADVAAVVPAGYNGVCHVFCQHTTAGLTINENADPDVPVDLARVLDTLASEDFPYRHTIEGPDDMPAHVKTSLTDSSLTIPIRDVRLCLGTWQGIFLWEHRRQGGRRRAMATINGEAK